MYDFLSHLLCKNGHDITIMCEDKQFRRIIDTKSTPIQSLFELELDFEAQERFKKDVEKAWRQELAQNDDPDEDWQTFKSRHAQINSRIRIKNKNEK